jgi:soluble lytic murein transglycosylase-like protein
MNRHLLNSPSSWKQTFWVFIVVSVPGWAQAPKPSEDAVARQRQAAAAMQESLARQQVAIQKQMAATSSSSGGFFLLTGPSSMGVNASMPAAPSEPIAPISLAPPCDPLPASQIDPLVDETAARDGLDPDVLRGVAKQESGFRPCAVSSKGAMGLMQLMPGTAADLGIDNPFDPVSNLDGGARFLKQLLDRYSGDLPKALGAYNAGPVKVDAVNGVPPIPETMEYVRQIMSTLPIR